MDLRTENIEAFLHVVELGSVSGAARHMGLSKSVVSKRVTGLEHEMDVCLLYRSTRLVQPTKAGQLFYAEAREAMQCLHHAAESVSQRANGLCGELRVVAPTCFGLRWLSDLAADFAAMHPRLELIFDVDDIVLEVDGKRYDVGIRVGRLRDTTMIARRLACSRRVLCCSPQYVAAHGAVTSVDDLGKRACLSSSRAAPASWSFSDAGTVSVPHRAGTQRRYVTNNEESLRCAVLRGLGLAVLPLYLVADAIKGCKAHGTRIVGGKIAESVMRNCLNAFACGCLACGGVNQYSNPV